MISSILFLPHGMQIIPGVEEPQPEGFADLNIEMTRLIEKFSREINDDLLLLTPHGYILEHNMTLYEHSEFIAPIYKIEQDSVVYGEKWKEFSIAGNLEMNNDIKKLADHHNLQLEYLVQGFSDYPLRLNWGESVPLYYLESLNQLNTSILCYPRARHFDFTQIMKINQRLVEVLTDLSRDIVLVISGDLAHTHIDDSPYGIHESAVPFDEMVMRWAKDSNAIQIDELIKLQENALACGMAGIHLIHLLRSQMKYQLKFSYYNDPTYFGMAILWWQLHQD